MRSRLCIAATLLGMFTAPLVAQETAAGLKPGQALPGPFQVYPVNGEHAGRLHCLVCANGLHPAVLLFTREVPEPEKPLGQLLKQLDAVLGKYPVVKAGAYVVVLSDDVKDYDKRQALANRVADAAKAVGTQRVIYSLDAAAGPKGYGLDPASSDVVILFHKHKVLANSTHGSERLQVADVGKIVQEVEKTLTEIDQHARPPRPGKGK